MGNVRDLNKDSTANNNAALGDKLDAIITLINELRTNFKSHVTKASIHYNGSAGVTDSANDLSNSAVDTL